VLVPDSGRGELGLVVALEHFLEEVLETAVVLLEDSVLGAKVERPLLLKRVLHAALGKTEDRLVGVVHAHGDSSRREIENGEVHLLSAIFGSEGHLELAGSGNDDVGRSVLVSESVTSDDDRLGPSWDEARNVLAENRLAEHGASEDIADSSVRALPHLLQVELFDAKLIRSDGGALDSNLVLLDGCGAIQSNLVVGLISVLHTKVIILNLEVQVGKNQLILDPLPNNPGHLITIHFHHRVIHLDLGHLAIE